MSIARIMMQAAAGSAGGGAVPIEEAFSTDLYSGNNSTQTITNGIDLAGEGGLVWRKSRTNTANHNLEDTGRGPSISLSSNLTNAQQNFSLTQITNFNSNGFSFSSDSNTNFSGQNYVAWTFRKAPRFFDVVTYTGNGNSTGQILNHNLGCRAGQVVIKQTDGAGGDWYVASYNGSSVYHYNFGWNRTTASDRSYAFSDSTYPINDTQFTTFIGSASNQTNASGAQYVAYIFAHDPLGPSGDGSDGLIACGSYVGTAASPGPAVNLGWRPQWLLVKNTNDGSESWHIHDDARDTSNPRTAVLRPNTNEAEGNNAGFSVNFDSTGFQAINSNGAWNANNQVFIYIAIRAEGV